jgi:hypothetical protein
MVVEARLSRFILLGAIVTAVLALPHLRSPEVQQRDDIPQLAEVEQRAEIVTSSGEYELVRVCETKGSDPETCVHVCRYMQAPEPDCIPPSELDSVNATTPAPSRLFGLRRISESHRLESCHLSH